MTKPIPVTDRLSVGGQPSGEDLRDLAGAGFRSVVNLRREGEANQALSPAAEGDEARSAGLAYGHLPVSVAELTPELLKRFREMVDQLPGPVYVHCGAGQRAGVFALLDEAGRSGASADETLEKARTIGIDLPDQAVVDFVRTSLRDR